MNSVRVPATRFSLVSALFLWVLFVLFLACFPSLIAITTRVWWKIEDSLMSTATPPSVWNNCHWCQGWKSFPSSFWVVNATMEEMTVPLRKLLTAAGDRLPSSFYLVWANPMAESEGRTYADAPRPNRGRSIRRAASRGVVPAQVPYTWLILFEWSREHDARRQGNGFLEPTGQRSDQN